MSSFDIPVRGARCLGVLLSTLLLAVAALSISASPAGAVAALYAEVAEEMTTEYAEAVCRQDQPDCYWGFGDRCRQQGKFQATCWAVTKFETEDESEYWGCRRHIRYTAEKRPYYQHKRVVKQRKFLGPWVCETHHVSKDY
jgi:uncharacterized membrane protein